MTSKLKIAVVGATGETGASVVNALLDSPEEFEVYILVRPASASKPAVLTYAQQGATVKPVELNEVTDALIQALTGLDVVVCCLTLLQAKEEMVLIETCSAAKVGRYVPSFFWSSVPCLRCNVTEREKKEQNLNLVKRLYLPCTVIDVGWRYQLALPEPPSGKLQTHKYSLRQIVGDGKAPLALINNSDIGKFVARIVSDQRTLNKMVFCYNEVLTMSQIWDMVEKLTSEAIPRVYISKQELEDKISRATETLAKSFDMAARFDLSTAQYMYMLGSRGDNTPEHAKYLGYLDARVLYPEFNPTALEAYVNGRLSGTIPNIYEGRNDQ